MDYAPLRPAAPIAASVSGLPAINLPADQLPHTNLSEWWYFTGHLTNDAGRQYGFEFVIFAAHRAGLAPVHAAHFAITDPGAQDFAFAQRTSVIHGAGANVDERLCVGGWELALGERSFAIAAIDGDMAIDLALSTPNPATLHDHDGIVDFEPYGWSYYYSYPRLAAEGILTVGGDPHSVTGQVWMDHQWGDFINVGSGWDWFALQLADGRDLTYSIVRDPEGGIALAYGTISEPDGTFRHLTDSDVRVEILSRWQSPTSRATYPASWSLQIPGEDIDLVVVPTVADQELDARPSTGSIYWEGSVSATQADQPAGRGYVELTGYAKNAPRLPEGAPADPFDQCG